MNLREMKRLGETTRFVFSAPRWWVSGLLIIFVTSLYILLSGFKLLVFLAYLPLPAYLSAALAIPISRLIGVRYWLKTELFLNLFQISFSIIFLILVQFIAYLSGPTFLNSGHMFLLSVFLMAFTLPLWLRWTYLASIITTDIKKAMALTLTYPVSQAIFFIFLYRSDPMVYSILLLYFLYSTTAILFGFIFTETMDRPLRRVLGTGGLEFTRWALEHYKEGTELGKIGLENVFRRFSRPVFIDIETLSFWEKGLYGIMAVHTAHMGPFGEVGGSNMPLKISEILGCRRFLSPHGASTHEMNPVAISEVNKIASAISSSLNGEIVGISESIRTGDKVKVMAQRFGDYLLVVETSHPDGAEDVDPSVAKVLEEKIHKFGYRGLIFIDAHNCSTEDADETFVYSERYPEMEKSVIEAAETLSNSKLYSAKVGIGICRDVGMESGVGPMGIISLIIEVNGHRTAYIVVDGNNMVKGLRDEIMASLSGIDNVEVMTSDNHYVNRVDGGSNPVGGDGDIEKIVRACEASVKKALEDLKEREIRLGRKRILIEAFGHGTPPKLMAVPESVSVMGKTLAFMDLFSLLLLDIILAMLI